MYEGRMLFAQLMDILPRDAFRACVKKYRGDIYCKDFSCRDQFLAMAFAQLTLREGRRGIQGAIVIFPVILAIEFRVSGFHLITTALSAERRIVGTRTIIRTTE